MVYVKAYVATLIVFLGIDYVWLAHIARDFFQSQLGSLMRDDVNYAVAGGFYLAYIGGVVYFAIAPALVKRSWQTAGVNGALLGMLAYGTYDLTNLATLKGWSLTMSIVDMAWGTLLTGTSAVAGYCAARAGNR